MAACHDWLMQWLFFAVPVFALFFNTYVLLVRPARRRHRPPFRAANGGGALDDGSYPVRTHGDAERALLLVMAGHGNAAAARKLIRRIAEENKWRDILKQLDAMPPVTEKREPRDTTRPYPKPAGVNADDKRLPVCPVCGMEDPIFLGAGTGTDALLMGWPAHRTCVEWLGEWKPAPPPYRPNPDLIGYADRGQRSYVGGTVATMPAPFTCERAMDKTAEAVTANLQALNAGQITLDELRERIVGAFGYPQMTITATAASAGTVTCDCGMSFSGNVADLDRSMEVHRTSGQHEQRLAYLNRMQQALPEPVSHMWCTCGKPFEGTTLAVKVAMDAHHASGECPHSARHREAG